VSAVIGDRGDESLGLHAELRPALRLPVVARGEGADARYPTPMIEPAAPDPVVEAYKKNPDREQR
jgi:hypothetical protein